MIVQAVPLTTRQLAIATILPALDAATALSQIDASPAALGSAVGLVWRSMLLWMILLLLLSVAGLFG